MEQKTTVIMPGQLLGHIPTVATGSGERCPAPFTGMLLGTAIESTGDAGSTCGVCGEGGLRNNRTPGWPPEHVINICHIALVVFCIALDVTLDRSNDLLQSIWERIGVEQLKSLWEIIAYHLLSHAHIQREQDGTKLLMNRWWQCLSNMMGCWS